MTKQAPKPSLRDVQAGAEGRASGDAASSAPAILKAEHKIVPIESIRPHPKNPRQGDVGAIAESIQENGFYGECLVQSSTNFIIAGSHRWRAAKAKGMAQVPVALIDVTDDEALRIMLADNRTNDLASYDDHRLADLLTTLTQSDRDLAGTGFSRDDLDDLVQKLEVPGLSQLAKKYGEPEEGALWPVIRLKLTPEMYERFTAALKSISGSDSDKIGTLLDRAASSMLA